MVLLLGLALLYKIENGIFNQGWVLIKDKVVYWRVRVHVQFAPSHPKIRRSTAGLGGRICAGYLGSNTAALEGGELRRLDSATDLRLPEDNYTVTFSYLCYQKSKQRQMFCIRNTLGKGFKLASLWIPHDLLPVCHLGKSKKRELWTPGSRIGATNCPVHKTSLVRAATILSVNSAPTNWPFARAVLPRLCGSVASFSTTIFDCSKCTERCRHHYFREMLRKGFSYT